MLAIGPQLAAVQAAHRERWAGLFAGRPSAWVPSVRRIDQAHDLEATDQAFEAWLAATLEALERGLAEAEDEVTFRPLVVEFWPLGVHFVDAVFGAPVHRSEGQFWSEKLTTSLTDLRPVDVEAAPLVRWALSGLARAVAALPPEIAVTTPVFSSPLNIAVNLFGERALLDLAAPGEGALRGMAIIAQAIRDLHQLVRRRFPEERVRFYASSFRYAPDGFGHICGCTTQLVSTETYANHIAPLDDLIVRSYPEGGTIHLCGHHTQHLECWRRMESVRALEMNDAAADDFPHYFRGLREDQLIYIAPTAKMTVERIMEVSGGRRVIVQGVLPERIPSDVGQT